jgi:hypothetical protein
MTEIVDHGCRGRRAVHRRSLFHFGEHGTIAYPAGTIISESINPAHELEWIQVGNAAMVAGRVMQDGPPGSIILIPAGQRFSFRWDPAVTTWQAFSHFHSSDPCLIPPQSRWPLTLRA